MEAIRGVIEAASGYQIERDDGKTVPIILNNKPADFATGWLPKAYFVGFPPFIFLELQHINGRSAVWILDKNGRFLVNSIAQLSVSDQGVLREHAQRQIDIVIFGFLHDINFSRDERARDFFAMGRGTRDEIARFGSKPVLPTPRAVAIGACHDIAIPGLGGETIQLRPDIIRTCLETDPQQSYVAACQGGLMTWPSPVDGLAVTEMRGLVLSHVLTAWRCVDRRNGLVFFVMASGFGAAAASIWLPAANCLIYGGNFRRGSVSLTASTSYVQTTINHLLEHGQKLLTFLDRPVGRFAQFTWPPPAVHIGHYHWNELPGLEQIVARLKPRDYPLVYDLGGASGNGFYGELHALFPELKGNVDLSCSSFAAMSGHSYARGVQIIRFGGDYVSAAIRRRIANVVALAPAAEEARRMMGGAKGPIVVIGLRVENRTVVDLCDFYAGIAALIAGHFGSLTLIIDGHNSKPKTGASDTYTSYMEQRATTKPVEIERQLVADLRMALLNKPVKIIDCVGMTLPDNLAWMKAADFCIAPWGAGLAKYRWALNLPSYVLISNVCRTSKGDVHIYHDPDHMETPSRQIFVSKDLVTDRPDIPTLVSMDAAFTPYYVNYEVDIEGAAKEIIEALAELSGTRTGWSRARST